MTFKEILLTADQDEIKALTQAVRPNNRICGLNVDDITEWHFGTVMEIAERANDLSVLEIIRAATNNRVKDQEVLKEKAAVVFSFLRHLGLEIEKVGKMMQQLRSDPEPELEQAGIDELNKFGSTNIYYSISKDPNEWNRLSETKFSKMFVKLMLDKEHSEIQKKYNKILTDKARQKIK